MCVHGFGPRLPKGLATRRTANGLPLGRAALLAAAHGALSSALSRVFLHVSAEQSIDARLITWALFLIPIQDIAIDSYGELRFPAHRLQASPNDCPGKHLRCQFRRVRKINSAILQCLYSLP